MIITIPEKFNLEVTYTLAVLLENILGLEYTLEVSPDAQNFIIKVSENKKVVIVNSFFIHLDENDYLRFENIPTKVSSFVADNDEKIPVIYGRDHIDENEGEILCHIDLIASSFFMLSRWEETVRDQKDIHGRFSSYSSLAFKEGFLQVPVVNIYANLLWNLLEKSGISQQRKTRTFKKTWTIDMDMISMWPHWYSGIKSIGGDLLKRKSLESAKARSKYYLNYLRTNQDPYSNQADLAELEDNFDDIYYYWIVDSRFDHETNIPINEKKLRSNIKLVQSRGRNIGLHPSYGSYKNLDDLKKQKSYLEQLSDSDISEVRQHFLQVDVTDTWNLWEQAGFKVDSTMGFGDNIGFRHGICMAFPLFDCVKRKQLSVLERPLLFSDSAISYYLDEEIGKTKKNTEKLLSEVKKYNGEFVFLWHNSSFYTPEWETYLPLFEQIKDFS